MSDQTIVVIGCSRDRDYSFLLPLTCLCWRDIVGYAPRAMLVGDENDWRDHCPTRVVVEALEHHRIAYRFVAVVEGYPPHTTAQNCRQHAAADSSIPDDAWIMPADADLWPLRHDFYHRHEGTQHRAVLYYGNGDHFQGKEVTIERSSHGLGTQTIPTCHTVMRARDWRAIYGFVRNDVAASIKKSLDAWLPTRAVVPGRDANMNLWMSDQQLMTEALCQQTWFPQMAFSIERRGHPPVDRLDRSVLEYWGDNLDVSRWTDAHLHKAPDSDEHWRDELKILCAHLPQHVEWANAYREEYARVP